VVNKLKLSDISGVFLCVDKGLDPVVLSRMSAFVDRTIEFAPGDVNPNPSPPR
jgi:hypothetical protein